MEEIIGSSNSNTDWLQLQTYKKLVEIEKDIRPPLVETINKEPQSWLSRIIADFFGVFIGYIGFFFILNFIRSSITHTPLYRWYWMYFGPYYFITKAPMLTNEWTREEELINDVEGSTCLQNAKNNYETCKSNGGSLFRCTEQKDADEIDCLAYPKCSTQNINTMIDLYINFIPVVGYDTTKSLMDKLRFLNPLVGIAEQIFTDNIPEFNPRPQTGRHSLNQDQKNALRSEDTINNLRIICMEDKGKLGIRVNGLSYDDIDKYFNDNFKNLK